MTEQQGDYSIQDEVQETLDMLGKVYDQDTSYEIHTGEKVLRDEGEGMREYQTGAWIKIAASFRDKHLRKLKGSRLGVWICIVLHINENNDCHPSIETICKETGYSNREVIDCIRELEKGGYLSVIRGQERYNVYHVNFGAAYGKGNDPTSEESSQVKKSAGNSEEKRAESVLKTSLKEEPIKKNHKRERAALDFKSMTVGEARRLPTIKLYADATDYFPGSILWETVHNTITEKALTFEQIHSAAVAWAGRGFKPSNVQGILEWAVNGIPANGHSLQTQDVKPAVNASAVEATRQYNDQRWDFTPAPPPVDLQKPVLKQPERRNRR